ncbi:SCO2524 family protein [Streptomyces sp. NPDC047072]|uniref:SCO2524 family protein n=1 Tax=Streptomyces sp. NPDC047072 TaxID=3154809 RepID=UPI0033EAFF07
MQISPRRQLLDVWSGIVNGCVTEGKWNGWADGDRGSVEDAERLLCLMYPATEIPDFRLGDPDLLQDDVQRVLAELGGPLDVPEALCRALGDFTATHTRDGAPDFSAGGYLAGAEPGREATAAQRRLATVDSFSMSLTLCLATLGFLKALTDRLPGGRVQTLADRLRRATEIRLTAAMVGLLRSFTVHVFSAESARGRLLCELLGQERTADRIVLDRFHDSFRRLRATIRDNFDPDGELLAGLARRHQLFECGWSWGIVRDAPPVPTDEEIGPQPEGCAAATASPYFTVVALDGIDDLFSERTLTLGLLNTEQQRLAEALRLRREIAQQYWSGIARFDRTHWPLEDIPWRTAEDSATAEYYTLCVTSVLVHGLGRRRSAEDDVTRAVTVLERLAERGRVTSRTTAGDPAVRLHSPGVVLELPGSELLGPPLCRTVNDFSPQLLKRAVQLSAMTRALPDRNRLLALAEQTMEHLWLRRRREGAGAGLWDEVRGIDPLAPIPEAEPSWGFTERVVEALVAAAGLYAQPPPRSETLAELARTMIGEAAHLLGVEQQRPAPGTTSPAGQSLAAVGSRLSRAGRLVEDRPGTACALAMSVLADLDALARARETAPGGGHTP